MIKRTTIEIDDQLLLPPPLTTIWGFGCSAAQTIASATAAGSETGGVRRGSTPSRDRTCAKKGVSMAEGRFVVTATRASSSINSMRSASEKPITPCLAAQ